LGQADVTSTRHHRQFQQPGENCPTGKSVEIFLMSADLSLAGDGRDRVRGKTIFFRRFNLIWVVQS